MSVILDPTFTSEDHRYTDAAGNIVPSVTELIGRHWPVDTSFYAKSGTDRGTSIHAHTQAIDTGMLTIDQFEGDEHEGYLRAWEKFKADNVKNFIWIEQKFLVEEFGYAGTVDRVYEDMKGKIALGDIKTGADEKWHELQQAAYTLAASLAGIPVEKILTVQLMANGNYKIITNDLEKGLFGWKCLIGWHNYRQERKKK